MLGVEDGSIFARFGDEERMFGAGFQLLKIQEQSLVVGR